MPTRLRDHAEGTAVAATLLDLQVGTRLRSGDELRLFEEGVGKAVINPHRRSPLIRARHQAANRNQVG